MNAGVTEWRPSASLATLQCRARALAAARDFFTQRDMLEVETPLIVTHPVSDPQLANVGCRLSVRPAQAFFLHTSPEYHMKRLLAAGAPDLWQIGKVFRDGEIGPRHLPEFTLIEWYRRAIDYQDFIGETLDLVGTIAAAAGRRLPVATRHAYSSLLRSVTGVDPLDTDLSIIRARAAALLRGSLTPTLIAGLGDDRSAWLDLLVVHAVEPWLRGQGLVVVDRYPAPQAALARLDRNDPRVAERFEIYLDGIELANGYHELADPDEQERRFRADNARRRELDRPEAMPDTALLAALRHGLPDCCGVALGFDRLLMACLGLGRIAEAVGFATTAAD